MSKKSNGWGAFWAGFAAFIFIPKAMAKGDKKKEFDIRLAMFFIPLAIFVITVTIMEYMGYFK